MCMPYEQRYWDFLPRPIETIEVPFSPSKSGFHVDFLGFPQLQSLSISYPFKMIQDVREPGPSREG